MKIRQYASNKYFVALGAIVGIALVGTLLLVFSSAATSVTNFEPENSSVTSPAQIVSDQNASGGQAIKFSSTVPLDGVLFGSNRPDEADANYTAAEAQLGRPFDTVRIFHSSWATTFTKELEYANKGKIVETSYKLWGSWRSVSDELRTAGSTRRTQVETMARNMQSQMPGPFFVVFNHEPENDVDDANGQSAQDYSDMVCAFHDIFKAQGATKALITVAAIRDNYYSNTSLGAAMYPGDQCLDWNGADSYNFFTSEKTTNWRSFEQGLKNLNSDGSAGSVTGWYQWATTDFTGQPCTIKNNPTCYNVRRLDGTVEQKQAKGKLPLIIGEWGTVEYYPCISSGCNTPHAGDPTKKAAWFQQALADLKTKLPQIKVINHWGTISVSGGSTNFHCVGNDTRFNTTLPADMDCTTDLSAVPTSYTAPSFSAFKNISLDPFVNITAGLSDGTASSPAAQKRFQFIIAQTP